MNYQRKNGFLNFCCALVPGAGQMFNGYMQRGLSLIVLFCLGFGMASIISAFAVVMPVVWMFSFFDTYDLIHHLERGDAKNDAFIGLDCRAFQNLLPNYNKVIGWVLVGLGVWALYDGVVQPALSSLLFAIGLDSLVYGVLYRIPSVVVAVLLIAGGLYLLGGSKRAQHSEPSHTDAAEEIPYPHE